MADALHLPFAGEEIVRKRSADLEEPKWLLDDRLAGVELYKELPVETNQLFTLYIDLRLANWSEINTYLQTGDATHVAETVPEGTAALIEVAEDRVVARGLSAEAREAGVVLDSFANVVRTNPRLIEETIGNGT